MVRARAVHLDGANKDSTPLGLTVNNKTIAEVDVTYFFNKNIAAELILTVPQKHTLSAGGAALARSSTCHPHCWRSTTLRPPASSLMWARA